MTNGSGKAVYKDADGKLTTDAETKEFLRGIQLCAAISAQTASDQTGLFRVSAYSGTEKRLKEMEEKIANYEAKESKEARAKEVVKAMEKHKIPAYLRDRLAKSISDDEDIEDAVSAYKQAW